MAYWNAHRRQWNDAPPQIDGPVELYRPVEDGTENLPADANVEVEFHAEYPTLADAIDGVDCCGRWFLSAPGRGRYTHFLNSMPGGVDVVPI